MVKIVLLGVLVMLAFTEILIKGIPLVSKHVRFVFFFLVYMVFSLLLGVLSGYEFSMEIDNALIQYYMITPICVLLLSTVVGKFNYRKEYLWKCIVVLTCLLAVLDVAKVASSMVGLSLPFLNFIDLGSLDMTEGLAVRASNETSLLFLLPIIIFLLVNDTGKKLFAVYLVTTLFGLAYAFISGRRILDIEIVISFAYALWYYKMKKQKNTPPPQAVRKKRHLLLWTTILLTMLIVTYGDRLMKYISDMSGVEDVLGLAVDTVANGLSLGASGVSKRIGNTDALIDMWYNSPFWGNGLNSYAENSLASDETKWSYEVFFIAWLAQTGIIGMLFWGLVILYVMKRMRLFGKKGDIRYSALMLGFVCYMLASATNPMIYLIWPWMIVISFCIQSKYYLKTELT